MEIIDDFLLKFENIIFKDHLELINEFKSEYTDFDTYNKPCPHDNSNEDVVGMCGCCFFHMRKRKVIKIIEKYQKLIKYLSSPFINQSCKRKKCDEDE